MKEFFAHIPTYVYILFGLLIYIGYKRCFTRIIRVERLLLLPAIFLFLSLHGVINLFHPNIPDILIWMSGNILGIALGAFHIHSQTIRADHKHKLISVPGNCLMFVLTMLIFACEFFINYSIKAKLPFAQTISFKWVSVFALGTIAGITIGRNITYIFKYKKAPSEQLKALN